MEITPITEDNIDCYEAFLGKDTAENIGRTYYRGLAAHKVGESRPAGALVWQLRHEEGTDELSISDIEWIRIEDEEAQDELFFAYKKQVDTEHIKDSYFTIAASKRKNELDALKRAGFNTFLHEGDEIIVSLEELLSMPLLKSRKLAPNVMSIGELKPRKFYAGIRRSVLMGRRGVCEDLSELTMEFFDKDISACIMEDGKVQGFLLFHKTSSGSLSIQLLSAFVEDPGKALAMMIRQAAISAEKKYPPDTLMILNRHNDSSLLLAEKLFPKGFGRPVYKGSRKENP